MQAAEEQGKGALWGGIIGAGAKILAADPFDWF
jgi:gas vesicle protein